MIKFAKKEWGLIKLASLPISCSIFKLRITPHHSTARIIDSNIRTLTVDFPPLCENADLTVVGRSSARNHKYGRMIE
jgi:hypothetical protein